MAWKKINLRNPGGTTGEFVTVYDPATRGQTSTDWPGRLAHGETAIHTEIPDRPGEPHQWNDATAQWELPIAELEAAIRSRRNRLLRECDWTQLPDVLANGRLTQQQVDAWKAYRQALADMPANTPDPTSPVWPQPPEAP